MINSEIGSLKHILKEAVKRRGIAARRHPLAARVSHLAGNFGNIRRRVMQRA